MKKRAGRDGMAAKRVAPHDRVINEKRKTDLLAVNHQICFLCTDNLSAEIHRSLGVHPK